MFVQTLQEQMNKQTRILNIILEAWTKQETHNKAMEAELGRIKNELKRSRKSARRRRKSAKRSRPSCTEPSSK